MTSRLEASLAAADRASSLSSMGSGSLSRQVNRHAESSTCGYDRGSLNSNHNSHGSLPSMGHKKRQAAADCISVLTVLQWAES